MKRKFPYSSKTDISYLGEEPWSFDEIRKAYFDDFTAVEEYIYSRLDGKKIESQLDQLQLTFEIFSNSVDELLASIELFKSYEDRGKNWKNGNNSIINFVEMNIQRGIYSSCALAMALVDHYRKLDKFLSIVGYSDKRNEVFSKSQTHAFIQSLRNYSLHSKITPVNWNITYNFQDRRKEISFILSKEKLLEWDGWSNDLKIFIKDSLRGIDVEVFFKEYAKKAETLYEWYRNSAIDQHIEKYRKYLFYKNYIEGLKQYYSVNLAVSTAVNNKVSNPYTYIEKYLTSKQFDVINALPRHSVEQVEQLIAFVDTYNMCDDNFRNNLYKLFSVKAK